MSHADVGNLSSPLGVELMLGHSVTEKTLTIGRFQIPSREGTLQATKTMQAGLAFLEVSGENLVLTYSATRSIWFKYHPVFELMLRSFNLSKQPR